MAAESIANGESASFQGHLSPAEQLQKKHAADEAHKATIEDVVDEEDIIHPPPSSMRQSEKPGEAPSSALESASEPKSEKAAGKQKAREEQNVPNQGTAAQPPSAFDPKSEELFPALGGGPKSRTSAPIASAWGFKKPAAPANNGPTVTNGYGHASSAASSRTSTPASGVLTPNSSNAPIQHTRTSIPQYMSMPGRHSERVQFAPSQLLPRNQLKKPLQDVLRDINKRSKATIEMKPGPAGVVYFEGRGPVDAVRQALKDVAKEVGSKQAVKVPIPASVRPHVIGRQGATIQGISKRTGARIQVPKAEEVLGVVEDDDSMTIDVTIEGDAVAAEMARREIEAIVNDRTSTVNLRLKDVPAEFYPFIAGPHNTRVNAMAEGKDLRISVPQYHTWSHQPPPQALAGDMPPQFTSHPQSHITLAGDRLAVQEARANIERQVEELRREITLSQLAINRGQHQFVVGDRGGSLHDLLAETGCAVILPPESDDTEMLTVTGPHDKIELGIDKVMNLATSMQMASVDVARQHSNAPMGAQTHARALTRYLQQRRAIEQLEELYDSRIVLPVAEEGPMNWEVYSRDGKNTIRARSDIINLINAHPPARIRHVDVDPFFHQHIYEQSARRIQDEFGVRLLLPDEVYQTPQVLLVYEGMPDTSANYEIPRQRPSAADIKQFEQALQEAQAHILELVSGHQEISSRGLEVPSKYHEKVRKHVLKEQKTLPPGVIPVRLTVSESPSMNGSGPITNDALIQELMLRGPSDNVDSLFSNILAFIEQEKQDELERGYTTSFDFPQKYANHLIGRRGENINKYREEFDVDIQVHEGKVEVKGPKAKADAAKSKILALSKQLEDEATHVLKIAPKYHREMIGAKGSQVNRLQDRYNVRVQFPRNASMHDDQSLAESEVTNHKMGRNNQATDEVIIRGPRRGADEARDELLSLLQWTVDNSHSATVSVAQDHLPFLIGQGGREMESIREITGARIDVPGSREIADPSGRVEIKLKGTKKQVDEAKKLLESRVKIFDESITRMINIDKMYHKALIGGGGANIRNMIIAAGGPDDRRELNRAVRFPRPDSDDSSIRVEGNKAMVEKIIASIKAFVDQRESQVTDIVEVAPEKHRLLIGHMGESRRALETKFNVNIDIPKQSQQGPARSQVKVAGQPDDVEKAKGHILELTKEQEGQTVYVPRKLHHAVSENGQLFRRLRHDHKVMVDHAGQQPPTRPNIGPQPRVNGGSPLPLITDEESTKDQFPWEVVENSGEGAEEGEIPWVLRGSAESIARARSALQKAIDQAHEQSHIGYLILPDPRTYRFVVGPGGSQINSIRKQTKCKVTVPRDQAKGEAIEIVGSKEGVEQAKDIILDIVRGSGNGSMGG